MVQADPREAYVLWLGYLSKDSEVAISHVFPFTGPSTPKSAEPSPEDLTTLAERLRSTGEFVFAQLHSHPGLAFHSLEDDAYAFSLKRGFVSVVVPWFGRRLSKDLTSCAFYERDDGWRRWRDSEVRRRVAITG